MDRAYPVLEIEDELKRKLAGSPVVILQAPPGAGKSTVLPLRLLQEPWLKGQKMILLEPRRLAARSVAARLASQLGEEVGETVGYRIRFETRVSERTRIEVVTEGILTRLIQNNATLEGIGLVIFDEFHERSLQADLALALSLQVQQMLRDDLRLLIMSATLDGEQLSSKLNGAPIVTSLGRQHPVSLKYVPVDADSHLSAKVFSVIRKALAAEKGDLLVFLPGTGEILRTQQLLEEAGVGAIVYPLYGELPFRQQQQAILPDPSGARKVVLTTSIAETSLTIEGIGVVIDSGWARVPRFDPRSGLTRLETVKVSRDAADQRAGRAGRLGPGVAYRMWAEATHAHLLAHRAPEILEADLAPLLLELSLWGVGDVHSLTWITPPPSGAVKQAQDLLTQLDALEDGRITPRGREMVKLPTHPRLAHLLLEAKGWSQRALCLATDVTALLEERDPLPREAGADASLRVETLRKWRGGQRVQADRNALERIEKLAASWRRLFNCYPDNAIVADKEVGELLALAYPERIARQTDKNSERFKLANGRVVKLPPHDPLTRESWLSVAHLDAGGGEGKIFMAAPLQEADLEHLATVHEVVRWDDTRGMVEAVKEKRIGNLVLKSVPLQAIPRDKKMAVLCDHIRNSGLKVLGWGEPQQNWQARVLSLRLWRTEEEWPDVSDAALLASLENWLVPFLEPVTRQRDLEGLDLPAITSTLLPWALQSRLDEWAPSRLEVPSGSFIQVQYFSDGRAPIMEVRLQEMFGLPETPTVNQGRTRVLLHLLSPGYKPVQVTQDLKSFWQVAYHEVRKELRMRYPKHSWPDDPWTAEAVRGVRRKVQ
ncbi:MAG: ATP-dependent helicase HrpB [Bacteroidota bacterium]